MPSLTLLRSIRYNAGTKEITRMSDNPTDSDLNFSYTSPVVLFLELPSALKYKKMRFYFDGFTMSTTVNVTATPVLKYKIVDKGIDAIAPGVGQIYDPTDLISGTQTNHTGTVETTLEPIQGTSSTWTRSYFLDQSLYVGTGKILIIEFSCKETTIGAKINENKAAIDLFNQYTDLGNDFDNLVAIYPVNVNVKKTSPIIFTWANNANIVDADMGGTTYYLPSLSHVLEYRKKGGQTSETITTQDANYYQEVAADTFQINPYEYRITLNTYEDYSLTSDWFEFNAIGANDAPTINSVTNDSIPLISWTDVNQEAYEVRIKDADQKVIYYSGVLAGTAQSYRLPKMLADGSYIVEVREINIYGYYSGWGSLEFTLDPTAVNAPTNIFATTNNKYGVEISGTPDENAQKTYVVRRKVGSDDVEILGEYTGGIFTDYTAEGNTFYEYTLRNYNYAYNDGFWVTIQVKVKQVVIRDGRNPENFIPLDKSERENFGPQWTEDADRVLFNCLGRRYPVKEVGEWVNSLRTFSAYVHNRDLNRLLDMVLNAAKVYYMADGEYFACDMAIEDQGTYNQNGRIINFTMTRIADDESVSII